MYRIFDSDWTAHYSRSAVFTKMLWQKSMFAIFFCILISLDPAVDGCNSSSKGKCSCAGDENPGQLCHRLEDFKSSLLFNKD